jgi:ATP-dependent Clp protease ATP-binding subunit ClpB
VYGARPLKRFIQQHLETPISRLIISGDLFTGSEVHASVKDGKILIE